VVVDGRDIGTVVFPDAALKVFLTADPEARARRRLMQEGRPLDRAALTAETERQARRDQADSAREVAPLKPAPDAMMLDTTSLDFEQQVARIVEEARSVAGFA
jgi:cytidylate kinase